MGKGFDENNLSRNELVISLDLNKHPKECTNLSLVSCKNALKSNEGNYIKQDIGTESVEAINTALYNHFSKAKLNNKITSYIIEKIIPCTNEFIIFAYSNFYITNSINSKNERYRYMNIFRYNEILNKCSDAIIPYEIKKYNSNEANLYLDGALKYHRGNINGAVTYNSNNELILAFCESDCLDNTIEKVGEPLKLINLGYWDENNNLIIDSNLNPKTFALCPEVKIPNPYNIEIIDGASKKGWYNFFIRYKIDNYNYTKWYSIGNSIYLDEFKKQIIYDHYQGVVNDTEYNDVRLIEDYLSNDIDICNKSIQFDINCDNIYNKYQIGFTCSTKTYVDARATDDIDINETTFVLKYKDTNEIDKNEFILNYQNYFNVKNIINYNNRLYISNYKEYNIIDEDNIEEIKEKVNSVTILNYNSTLKLNEDYKNIIICKTNNEINNKITLNISLPVSSIFNTSYIYALENKLYTATYDELKSPGIIDKATFRRDFKIKMRQKLESLYPSSYNRIIIIYYIDTEVLLKYNELETNFWNNGIDRFNNVSDWLHKNKGNLPFRIFIPIDTMLSENYIEYNNILKINNFDKYNDSSKYIGFYAINFDTLDIITTNYKGTLENHNSVFASENICGIPLSIDIIEKQGFTYLSKIEDINYTLIPNQPYNFYIHFLDKYGNVSDGVKIDFTKYINDTKYFIKIDDDYYILAYNKIIRDTEDNEEFTNLYININLKINLNEIKIANIKHKDIVYDINGTKKYFLNLSSEERYEITNLINKCKNIILECVENKSITYTLGEIYYKLVYKNKYDEYIDNFDNNDNYVNTTIIKYFPYKDSAEFNFVNINNNIYFITNNINNNYFININISFKYKINTFSNISDKYFISYEKVDNSLLHQCISFYKNIELNNYFEQDKNATIKIFDDSYTSLQIFDDNLNYEDYINISSDYIKIFKCKKDYNNLSNIYLKYKEFYKNYSKSKIEYLVANSIKDKNKNIGTNLKLEEILIDNNLKDDFLLVWIYDSIKNLFNNTVKTLIRCSDYIDSSIGNIGNYNVVKVKSYSHWGEGSALVFNCNGYRYDAEGHLKSYDNSLVYEKDLNIANIKYPKIMEDFEEFKQFNNAPQKLMIIKNNVKYENSLSTEAQYYEGTSFLCQDTVDLFKNNTLKHDDSIINIYTNYDKTRLNKTNYDKTIRRSNYIKDESLEIGWRKFELENYKNITENKGNIVKLIGIGELLLVHTEHSLFQFDKNNLLITANKAVQLGQQDTFDIDYKEIFTSEFGFGGLQDKDSAIVGEFGYIYYNDDFNKIYQYDGGQVNDISSTISWFLMKYKPTDVRFVEDRDNKRILCRFSYKKLGQKINNVVNYTVEDLILSYNYDSKSFISEHDFPFNDWFNTKKFTYILHNMCSISKLYDNGIKLTRTEIFTQEYNKYNYNSLELNNITNDYELVHRVTVKTMSFKFIINESYNTPKILNCLSYKLYKKVSLSDGPDNAIDNEYEDYVSKDEFSSITEKIPYSGHKLRVYNDLCDTGELDISTNSKGSKSKYNDVTKPHYDLGNFNFNYLRDKNTKSRIYGNYFIVEFIFEADNINDIEFESLNYSITKRVI